VKNRILLISLAVVFVVGLSLVGCGGALPPTAPTSIKVGLARDLDGPLAVFQCGYGGPCYRWFAANVNADVGHAGAIHLSYYDGGGAATWVPIELDVKDFDVATWDIASVTEGLIETDKCDFIWGGPGTDCIFTQAPVCNAAAKVLITLEGGASSMIWDHNIDSWPYVWVTLSFANWNQLPVLHDMLKAKLGREPKVYMTYIGGAGSTHGIEYSTEAKTVFGANFIDGGFHDYSLTATTASALIESAKSALGDPAHPNYDLCIFQTYPWNVYTISIALLGSDFNPPLVLFGPGANSGDYCVNMGAISGKGNAAVEGVLSYVVATEKSSAKLAQMYADLGAQNEKDWAAGIGCTPGAATKGTQIVDYWGNPCYIAGLQMWAKAVANAGRLDSTLVRNELAKFSSSNPCDTVLGGCWFTVFGNGNGGGILAYQCHPGEIGQWQSGKYEITGGLSPTAALEYPMTGKWSWLPS
jgi:hypothetical protein